MEDEYVLVMEFLDSSDSFANGFTLGQFWVRMSNAETVEGQILKDCFEQLELMATHFGYELEVIEESEKWLNVKVAPIDILNSMG